MLSNLLRGRVNAERWLVATVHDLLTRRELKREEPVVRLI